MIEPSEGDMLAVVCACQPETHEAEPTAFYVFRNLRGEIVFLCPDCGETFSADDAE